MCSMKVTTGTTEKRPPNPPVAIRLGENSLPLDSYRAKTGQSRSEAINTLLAFALRKGQPVAKARLDMEAGEKDRVRRQLRLTPSEHQLALQLTGKFGFRNMQTFLIRLLRVAADEAALLRQDELNALLASNLQLAGIGRNLNQIAKRLNTLDEGLKGGDMQVIEEAVAMCRSHVQGVAQVVIKATERPRLIVEKLERGSL